MSKDMVKRPEHYCFSKFEPKDVIREWGLNFNLGSVVKYIARAGRKDDIVQDLKKAREFLTFEIEALEAERAGKSAKAPDHPNCRCAQAHTMTEAEKELFKGVDVVKVVFPADVPPDYANKVIEKALKDVKMITPY